MESGNDFEFEWREYASCKDIAFQFAPDDNPFFKLGRGNTYELARQICASCSVVVDCLIDSLEEPAGMFGCTSKNERDSIKRSMRIGKSFIKSVEQLWQHHRDEDDRKAPKKEIWKDWS